MRQWLADGRRGQALLEEMAQASRATLAARKRKTARSQRPVRRGEDNER